MIFDDFGFGPQDGYEFGLPQDFDNWMCDCWIGRAAWGSKYALHIILKDKARIISLCNKEYKITVGRKVMRIHVQPPRGMFFKFRILKPDIAMDVDAIKESLCNEEFTCSTLEFIEMEGRFGRVVSEHLSGILVPKKRNPDVSTIPEVIVYNDRVYPLEIMGYEKYLTCYQCFGRGHRKELCPNKAYCFTCRARHDGDVGFACREGRIDDVVTVPENVEKVALPVIVSDPLLLLPLPLLHQLKT